MSPDDPRHGTTAGAMKHYRDDDPICEPCRKARARACKRNKLRRIQGDPGLIEHGQVAEIVQPWLSMGFSATAVFRAAGCAFHYGGNAFRSGRQARRDTYAKLLDLTEDDFRDNDLVFADLTRRRIYSLRAAGHNLYEMPVADRGVWRNADYITVRVARDVRQYFRENEMRVGTNKNGSSRARNQGHQPPLAWDDPDTLAWVGKPALEAYAELNSDIDPVVVMRLLEGDRVPSTKAEKDAAMEQWVADGGSRAELCRWHGWHEGRYGRQGLTVVRGGAA